ncbi:hypothetical protein M2281_004692 [Mesorhizobium soli]|uniref:hypothetical protein n=1 Tax=Pseudaminobacter soli (ex Li et al. 2025) TaxID=1295366 RepID=UPI0024741D91|nr:hypothetical protein [Mesorhizobium soli]MDH6234078.1 hypothetical protein [Mesorhizobium soli]
MADGRTARPVSGEIMTDASVMGGALRPEIDPDIVDADFEIVASPEQRQPGAERQPKTFVPNGASTTGMEMLQRKVRERRAFQPFAKRGGPAFWTVGGGLVVAAFWISGGHMLLSQLPLPGSAEAAPFFTIAGVKSRVETTGGGQILFVDGEATNGGSLAGMLPELEIHVTGEDGRATFYKLGTSQTPLAPGGRFAFSSRLAVPKNGVKTVTVAFGE